MALVPAAKDAAAQEAEGGDALLDSLGYLDLEYEDPSMAARVHALIEEEMRRLPPRDYLEDRPVPTPSLSPMVRASFSRIDASEAPSAADAVRTGAMPDAPAADGGAEAWEGYIAAVKSRLEDQRRRLSRLEELSNDSAVDLWLLFGKQQEELQRYLGAQRGAVERDLQEINAARKFDQQSAAQKLFGYDAKRHKLTDRCMQLEMAGAMLAHDIVKLRKVAGERGEALPELPEGIREEIGALEAAAAPAPPP